MEAKDIFGEEPDSDDLSETPDIDALVTVEGRDYIVEHKTVEDACPNGGSHEYIAGAIACNKCGHFGNDATDRQRNYITSLLNQKKVDTGRRRHWTDKIEGTLGLSKRAASRLIDDLKGMEDDPEAKKREPFAMVKPTPEELPAGRYAIDNEHGELRFYQVWRGSRNADIIKVYLQHGPDDSEIPFRSAMVICKRIVAAGPLVAAQRYGREIGSCYACGRRLTNRVSRQLGIGPVCGGRDFGDEFKHLETIARAEIKAEGHDPDEVIEIDSE